jgi:hypothetical protein
MSAPAIAPLDRAAINRANSKHSTGPRTESGKQRSSLNALRHGLTAQSAVLPSEDPAAYDQHRLKFLDEYHPVTSTETQLVHELVATSWRLNRIPLLEADLLTRTDLGVLDAHRLLNSLSVQSQRLSRQFQKALDKLRDLRDAAALLELHKHKGIPWEPADHGFVFSKHQVERHERLVRLNEARHIDYVRFDMPQKSLKA